MRHETRCRAALPSLEQPTRGRTEDVRDHDLARVGARARARPRDDDDDDDDAREDESSSVFDTFGGDARGASDEDHRARGGRRGAIERRVARLEGDARGRRRARDRGLDGRATRERGDEGIGRRGRTND